MIKTIKDLDNKFIGETAYILGTGPSMRVFPDPEDFFADKFVIGLNQAWRYCNVDYCLTIHPHTIPLNLEEADTVFITKHKLQDHTYTQHFRRGNYDSFHLFKNKEDEKLFNWGYRGDSLYVSRGIHTGAVHLACRMGFKEIILVGCDFCTLNGDFHGHKQHTEFHNLTSWNVYLEYYYCAEFVRRKAKEEFKANVYSLNPFLGLKFTDLDYKRLCELNNLEPLPLPEEKEHAKRTKDLICNFIQ